MGTLRTERGKLELAKKFYDVDEIFLGKQNLGGKK